MSTNRCRRAASAILGAFALIGAFASAGATPLDCGELKSRIVAQENANHAPMVTIVKKEDVGPSKILGSCAGGTMRVVLATAGGAGPGVRTVASTRSTSARTCAAGESPTPPEVIKAYAPGGVVPNGKIACRLGGESIVVPAISHEATDNDPPCGPDIKVLSSALGPYKEWAAQVGKAGLSSDNPWGVAAGAVVTILVEIDPQVAHNATSNCGIATVVLPKSKVHFHHYVEMRYDSHMKDAFPIDQTAYGRAGAGEPFQKATWMDPIKLKSGSTLYGTEYKNWATESGNYRHVKEVLDVFE